MTDTLQFRRGTTAKTSAFTGLVGEITVDTDKKVAVVHDGTKAGGYALLRDDLSNIGPVKASVVPDADNVYSLGSPTKRWKDIYVGNNTIHIGDSTSFSGTSLVIDAGSNPTSLSQMPTLLASKLVAKPFSYNPGSGAISVRPSIEFQDSTGTSYPISFNTVTKEFSLDAAGDYGQGSLVAKKMTLGGDLVGSTAGNFRWDGNTTLGYDSTSTLTVKAATTFQGGTSFTGGVTLGDGNDTITINAGASNALNITSSTLSVDGTGVVITGNLTVNGSRTIVHATDVQVGDNILILNADIPGSQDPTLDAGLQVARGTAASVKWVWDETSDYWTPKGGDIGNVGTLTATTINATTLNAGNLVATSAAKLSTARSITLSGVVTGTASFDGSQDITITTSGTATGGAPMDYAWLRLTTDYAPGGTIAVGTAIPFDTVVGNLTLTSGRVTLKAGKTYYLTASVAANGSATTSNMDIQWYNATAGAYIGIQGLCRPMGSGNTYNSDTPATATITPATDTLVELRIVQTGAIRVYNTYTSAMIQQVAGAAGSTSNVNSSYVGAKMRKTVAGSYPNTTWTAISWDVADFDSSGFWSSASPTRFTVPAGVNKVRVSGGIGLGVAPVQLQLTKNGVGIGLMTSANAYSSFTSGVIPVVAGDYFILNVYQSSGTTATIQNQANTYFDIEVVDPVPVAISGFGSNTTSDYAFITIGSTSNATTNNSVAPMTAVTGTLAINNNRVTLKAGKTYRLEAAMRVNFASNTDYISFAWYSVGTSSYVGNSGQAVGPTYTSPSAQQTTAVAVVTPMVDTEFQVQFTGASLAGASASIFGGFSYATVEQIGGAANGMNYGPAGYAQMGLATSPTISTAAGTTIPFDSFTGNLTQNGNGVTLKAGRTYLLQSGLYFTNSKTTGYVNFNFHDGTNWLGVGGQALAGGYSGTSSPNTTATAIYRPSVDTTVYVKTSNVDATAPLALVGGFSYMNVVELAAAVDTFSTNETLTDRIWHDGKPVYRKVINFGALPNTTTKSVAHGITFSEIVGITGVGYNTSSGNRFPLPRVTTNTASLVEVWVDATYVSIGTTSDYSTATGKLTIEYTK